MENKNQQQEVATKNVETVKVVPVSMPGQTAQTGNTGTPIQVENVQYDMKVKPVESKIGLYMRVANMSMWFTVVFVCSFLSSIISRLTGEETSDLTSVTITAFSLAVITIPIFIIANKKRSDEIKKNPNLVDDLFYKKSLRANLMSSIVLVALSGFIMLSTFLTMAFTDNQVMASTPLSAFVFTAGFGGVLAFLWPLHAKTRR